MTLGEKQRLFPFLTSKFIVWCYANGYELVYGEVQRSQLQANANAASGVGISKSLHLLCLAVDFKLFIKGVYQTDSAAYAPLGAYWKSLHPLNRWGGDFKGKDGKPKPDGNHFSMEHEGVK